MSDKPVPATPAFEPTPTADPAAPAVPPEPQVLLVSSPFQPARTEPLLESETPFLAPTLERVEKADHSQSDAPPPAED